LYAQEFGGEPSSVRWKQVNTDTVRVIFPEGSDSIAARVAAITSVEQQKYNNLGGSWRKLSIVLHTQTNFSNAFVTLGPWRSEFFLTPPQNAFELGAMSWADQLSIHEYRHAQQFSNFNVGFSHVMRVLFGENGQLLANGASIPDWFFEGDAVYTETMLSKQGRGRLPLFLNGYKSLYLQNKQYSYMKLRNGSLRDFVPHHYPLGYLLVAYGREKYGDDFWKNVTYDAARFHSLFYPMQHAIKRYSNSSFNEFVENAFNYYKQQWSGQTISGLQFLDSTERNNVINEKYPYSAMDGSVIMLEESYRDIRKFVVRENDGSIKKIATQSICTDDYFSYNNGKIVYASFKPDPRWGNRQYGEIRVVDVASGQERKFVPAVSDHGIRPKFFAPDISHDGQQIIVIENSSAQRSFIHLIRISGELIRSFENSPAHTYSYPKFSADDKFIYVCDRNAKGEMSILKGTVDQKNLTAIIPYANRIIGFPVVHGDTLFFSCSNNGMDETWAYINSQQKTYRVASAVTGLYQACISNDKLIGSVFTADGYRLASVSPDWQATSIGDTLKDLYVFKPFQRADNSLLQSVSERDFKTSKYAKASGLFNFHSWNPDFSDPDYSFIVYGQNVLNTFQSQLYYTYNSDEHFHRVGYTGIYGGWYIQPFAGVNQTWNRSRVLNADSSLQWNETKVAAGLQLPLNFTGGKMYRSLHSSVGYNFVATQWQGIAKDLLQNSGFSYLQTRITYSQYIQQAIQHIYPRFGQSFSVQYRTGSTAHQFLLNGYFYFPGLVKTHNIVINLAYQHRDTSGKYFFDNNFPFSRGYTAVDYPRLWKAGANYHFHLFYPDWGSANLVYFLRVRANLFYDFTEAKSLRTGNHFNFASTGGEIFFDSKWWNQQLISFGIRYSRLLNDDVKGISHNQWELILPITL
jgi:hypothetical protein